MAKNTKKTAKQTAKETSGKKGGASAKKPEGKPDPAAKSGPATPKAEEKPKAKSSPVTTRKAPGQKVAPAELDSLRKPVDDAKKVLDEVKKEEDQILAKAKERVGKAKAAYQIALTPYRDACRKAKVKCEYEGGRGPNVSEKVYYLVEKAEKGVRVMIKGRPETEELISFSVLKDSLNREAYRYTDAHVGPRSEIGNTGGSLSNRLRAVLAK